MRLAAEVKLGYYPTPLHIATLLSQAFVPPTDDQPATALDPFCGTGEALAQFPVPLTFGVDLDETRIQEAATRLTSTLHADAWAVKTRTKGASLVFLNPPYMQDPISRERQEIRAVHTYLPWVHPHGYLVLIAPRSVVLYNQALFNERLRLLALWRFPDPDYAAFGQVILIGQPRRASDPPNDWSRWLTRDIPNDKPDNDHTWQDVKAPMWPRPLPTSLSPEWPLPVTLGFTLRATRPRPDQVIPLLAHTPAWDTLVAQSAPHDTLDLSRPIHTPLTLHRGHLATLLTAGRLTGAIGTGPERHLVRGRTMPYTVQTAETEDKRVEETRFRIELTTVHPDGTIRNWHDVAAAADITDDTEEEVS